MISYLYNVIYYLCNTHIWLWLLYYNIFIMSYSNETDPCSMLLVIMCVSIYMAMGFTIHMTWVVAWLNVIHMIGTKSTAFKSAQMLYNPQLIIIIYIWIISPEWLNWGYAFTFTVIIDSNKPLQIIGWWLSMLFFSLLFLSNTIIIII